MDSESVSLEELLTTEIILKILFGELTKYLCLGFTKLSQCLLWLSMFVQHQVVGGSQMVAKTPKLAVDGSKDKEPRYARAPSRPEICCPVLLLRANLNKSSAPAPYLYNHSYRWRCFIELLKIYLAHC